MSGARADRYRFSVEDETRIGAAVTGAYRAFGEPRHIDATTADALERIGAHAVGCSVHDLRDSERQMLRRVIRSAESIRRARSHPLR